VEGEDLALIAVHDVGEHPHQASVFGLAEERWVVERVDEFAQASHSGVATFGEEGTNGRPIDGLPRTDLHASTLLLVAWRQQIQESQRCRRRLTAVHES
jgi:hypothetical protein